MPNLKESEQHWWIAKFWHLPTTMAPILLPFSFHELNRQNEKDFLYKTLEKIKQIELVSIILRFVRPDDYGILSHPVEQIINVPWGRDAVETYLLYLDNLRSIQKRYCGILKRVADADMALWVLHAKYFEKTDKSIEIKRYYEEDSFLLQLRTKNLMAPLKTLDLSTLTLGLHRVRPRLAAAALCYLLEMAVRELDKFYFNADRTEIRLDEILNQLRNQTGIEEDFIQKLHKLRIIRNNFLHHDNCPKEEHLKEFIQVIQKIGTLLPGPHSNRW